MGLIFVHPQTRPGTAGLSSALNMDPSLMKKQIAGLALLGLLLMGPAPASVHAQAPDTLALTFDAAVRGALEASPEMQQMATRVDFAEARHRQARASRFLTEFNASTAHALAPGLTETSFPDDASYLDPDLRNDWENLRPFNQFEFEILQPLYTWGQLGGTLRAAHHGVALAEAEGAAKQEEITQRAGESYYALLLAEALFRLAAETGTALDQAKAEITRLLDEGDEDVDDADLFQLKIFEQEYRRRKSEVEQKRILARTALARQLRLPPGVTVAPETQALDPMPHRLDSLETYIALALTHRTEVARARAGLAAREALVDVARSDFYPKLFLGVSGRFSFVAGRRRQPNPFISDPYIGQSVRAGLGMRLNLNFAQTRAKVQQAEAQRDEVRYQREAATELIRFEVEEAYRNVMIAQEALAAQDEALQLSKEWLRTEQINFDLELGNTDNLVRAVQTNLDLQARYLEAVQRYNVALLRLFNKTGTLTQYVQSGTLVER